MCLCLLVCLWSRNPGYWPMNLARPVNLETIFALWRLNPQLPCVLQSWIILPYLFIFSYPLFRAFVWPIDEVRGQARKYCINNWPFPFYDLTTLIKKYQLIWLYSPSLFFSKLHFNVACLTPEVWWMFRKQKRYELFKKKTIWLSYQEVVSLYHYHHYDDHHHHKVDCTHKMAQLSGSREPLYSGARLLW